VITLKVRLILAMLLALVLTVIPLPDMVAHLRPQWVLLMALYIQFCLPDYFRVIWLFFLGLCLDVLLGSVLGEHAFALLLTSWFATNKTRRFSFFSTLQQMFLVIAFCICEQLVLYLIDASFGYQNKLQFVIETCLASTLCWPWLKWIADELFSVALIERTLRRSSF
jgi:rod shape-determining protein MreD